MAEANRNDSLTNSQSKQISGSQDGLELVSKDLNHLSAILHVYAGGLKNFFLLIFEKKMEIFSHF